MKSIRKSILTLAILGLCLSGTTIQAQTVYDQINVNLTSLEELQAHNCYYHYTSETTYAPEDIVALDRTVSTGRAVFGTNGIGLRYPSNPTVTLNQADIEFEVPGPGTYIIRMDEMYAPLGDSRIVQIFLNGLIGTNLHFASISFNDSEWHVFDQPLTLISDDLTNGHFTLNFRGWGWNVAYISNTITIMEHVVPPATCAEVQEQGYGLEWDLDGDCSVGLTDLAILASTWLNCNDPEDVHCTPNW